MGSDRFGISCDFKQLDQIKFKTGSNVLSKWTGCNHSCRNQALYRMNVKNDMYGKNFRLKKFRIDNKDTICGAKDKDLQQTFDNAKEKCKGKGNMKRMILFFERDTSKLNGEAKRPTEVLAKNDTCKFGEFTINLTEDVRSKLQQSGPFTDMFEGRFITKPGWLADKGVQKDDILMEWRYILPNSRTEQTSNATDGDKNPNGPSTRRLNNLASSLTKLIFHRARKVEFTGEDDNARSMFNTKKLRMGGLRGYHNRREIQKTFMDNVKGNEVSLGGCLEQKGIKAGDELVAFQHGEKNESTKKEDNKWHTRFANAAKLASTTTLTMWFISPNRKIEVSKVEVEDAGRRRLIALSDRFRRLREFQARTSM